MKPITVLLFVGILSLAILLAGCGDAEKYNLTNYPDSIIIKTFENAGLNPEAFSRRALRALRGEISIGKFTRDRAVAFLTEQRAKVFDGVAYSEISRLIERYAAIMFMPEGDDVSEIAMLAYIMFTPDSGSLDIPTLVGPQDRQVLLDFFDYLLRGI